MSFPSVPLARITISATTDGHIWYNGPCNPMTCTISSDHAKTMEVLEYYPTSIADARGALKVMYSDPAWDLEFCDYA